MATVSSTRTTCTGKETPFSVRICATARAVAGDKNSNADSNAAKTVALFPGKRVVFDCRGAEIMEQTVYVSGRASVPFIVSRWARTLLTAKQERYTTHMTESKAATFQKNIPVLITLSLFTMGMYYTPVLLKRYVTHGVVETYPGSPEYSYRMLLFGGGGALFTLLLFGLCFLLDALLNKKSSSPVVSSRTSS